jgi:CHAD domain-containing protein
MEATLERELKLRPRPGFRWPRLPGAPLRRRVLTSTYHDTADHRLLRAGIALRHRAGEARDPGCWQLKLPAAEGRLEVEVPATGSRRPPAQILALLAAHLRRSKLVRVATLRTERAGRRVREDGAVVAEVVLDRVAVLDGDRVVRRFRELEIELQPDADPEALERIAVRLREAGAEDTDGRSKLHRALGLDPTSPAEPRSDDPREVVTAMLARQRATLLAHDPGVRLGRDPESLHQLRVATRRLRAYLRAARPLLAGRRPESLRAELAWLGRGLGPVRDLDVLIADLGAQARTLEPEERAALAPLPAALAAERDAQREPHLETLGSRRYLALLRRLEAPLRFRATDVTLPALAGGAFDKLRAAADELPESPSDEALHRLRILVKRARYAAELAESVAGKRATRFLDRARKLQELLGDHQDARVAAARLRAAVDSASPPAFALAVGRLVERQQARRLAARAGLTHAWAKLDKSGRKAWG